MLANQLLISMPQQGGNNVFDKVVVYICEHNLRGAVGLIINCPTEFRLGFVFEQLNIHSEELAILGLPVFFGGPVQQDRGFVLHRPFNGFTATLSLNSEICVSTSTEILKRIASGHGPKDCLVTLGYAGWAEKQLEEEIKDNLWLTCEANENILYDVPAPARWQAAIDSLGIDLSKLIVSKGNA